MTKDNGSNRIWIELPVPQDKDPRVRQARGTELANLANKMLALLGVPSYGTQNYGFSYVQFDDGHGGIKRECYIKNEGVGFLYCQDSGHWFNLDYLSSREPIEDTGFKALEKPDHSLEP
jgi:hypothetical protein